MNTLKKSCFRRGARKLLVALRKLNPIERKQLMKNLKTCVAAAAMVALSGTAQAELVSLGDGTVKDTNTNLIWLQNWNVNGPKDWGTQKAWAEGLDFADSTD